MNPRDPSTTIAVLGIVVALAVLVQARCSSGATAETRDREVLARVIEVESSSHVDQSAAAYVLARRWRSTRHAQGWSFAEQVVRYSHVVRAWHERAEPRRPFTPRQRRILARPSASAYRVAERFLRGQLPDPCRRGRPMHWRARRGSELACGLGACEADTANLFLR